MYGDGDSPGKGDVAESLTKDKNETAAMFCLYKNTER